MQTLQEFAEEIAKRKEYELKALMRRGYAYRKDNERSLIFEVTNYEQPAVLKVYQEPALRVSFEPRNLLEFQSKSTSSVIKAPELLDYGMVSSSRGWMLMRRWEPGGTRFSIPLPPKQREVIVALFREYRENFPREPTHALDWMDVLSASEFHSARIAIWLLRGRAQEAERRLKNLPEVISPQKLKPWYEDTIAHLRTAFACCPMIWCHGEFRHENLYKSPKSNKWYLSQFTKMGYFPQGFEPAYIIWNDWFCYKPEMEYDEWLQGTKEWIELFGAGTWQSRLHLKACLLERCVGAVLADITVSDKKYEDQQRLIKRIFRFVREELRS